jgi:hypothetical protein
MERRTFLNFSSLALASTLVPFTRAIAADELLSSMPTAAKKALADVALNAATKAGASYADVRIGRYLNQFITTRDLNVENVANTESAGVGVRVIANGAYGFAATSDMSNDGIANAARQAVAIAKANAKLQSEPVRLAQGRHGRRRDLHEFDAVPGEPAKVLRFHRRLLHRAGRAPPVGPVPGHRRGQGHRQVPLALGPGRAGRQGL